MNFEQDLDGLVWTAKSRMPGVPLEWEEAIVYATEKRIYAHWEDREKLLAERPDFIHSLFTHKGRLYDTGSYPGIYDTLENKRADFYKNIRELAVSFNGDIYADTTDGKIVTKDNFQWFTLGAHNCLCAIDEGEYKGLYLLEHKVGADHQQTTSIRTHFTEFHKAPFERKYHMFADRLFTHEGKPYMVLAQKVWDIIEDISMDIISPVDPGINGFYSHKGILYAHTGTGQIFDYATQDVILEKKGSPIRHMCVAPASLIFGREKWPKR